MNHSRWARVSAFAVAVLCTAAAAAAAPIDVTLWRHETGDSEMQASAAAVARFNAAQSRYRIVTETLPQGSYQQAVVAAAMTRKLPCALDLDQPMVANFAWAGHLQPLEGALRPAGVEALIPGGRSHYKGKLYAVGQFDVALALFSRRSLLQKHQIREATLAQPYTAEEFRAILRKLKTAGLRYPLDLNAQWGGEWVSYAFSPWLQSAGADLIDRRNFTQVDGVLNSEAALRVVEYYQSLFNERLASRRPVDDQAFPVAARCSSTPARGRRPTTARSSATTSSCCRRPASAPRPRSAPARGNGPSPAVARSPKARGCSWST